MRKSEAEALFLEDVRDKKRTGSGIFSRTGKRGYVGKMLFPYELGTAKEKRAYKKAGKVKVSNIYEQILPRAEFEKLEPHEQKNRIQYWRSTYNTKEIQKGMGIASATFYGYIEKLGLPKGRRGKGNKKPAEKKTIAPAPAQEQTEAIREVATTAEKTPEPLLVLNGLNIAYNGIYKAEQIRKMFTKLDIILDSEENDFEIELTIKERKGAKRQ